MRAVADQLGLDWLSTLPAELRADDDATFAAEFRCFAIGHEVLTHSVYARDGELAGSDADGYPATQAEMTAAFEFATDVLVAHPPAHACVLDVGLLDDGRWAVVEANPCWSSALHGCHPEAALEVIRSA